MRFAGTLWLILLVACGPSPELRDGGTEPYADAPPDAVPSCHWDCFGVTFCVDGEVRRNFHAPVPCRYWTGVCPFEVLGTCPTTCADLPPADSFGGGDWVLWCEGSEERRAGDPCGTDEDCQPPAPTSGQRNYLTCDTGTGVCVTAPPPMAPDAGEGCGVSFDALSSSEGDAYGVVEAPACSSGYCLFVAHAAPACDLDGCATVCEDDWDCPPELSCLERFDWTGRSVGDGGGPPVRVCTSNLVDTGLSCH